MTDAVTRGPAYVIRTDRLVIRCWDPADTPLLKSALDASVEHLRPWMGWMKGPEPLSEHIRRARLHRGLFDTDQDYIYAIFNADETEVWGGTGLHPRIGPHGREIGYWIHAQQIGRGVATEASAALTRVAFEVHKVDRVEIRCDPRNHRSAGVPRKLAFVHEATLRQNERDVSGELRDTMVWALIRAAYPASPASKANVTAFDACGERLL
jgi:RimJ/RimL family protein N-acetyltransferase